MMKSVLVALVTLVALGSAARLPNIIGGHDVDRSGKYPWQGSLQSYGRHDCGCSLISTTWAVTAAHCTTTSASRYTVVFGMHDMKMWYGKPQMYQVQSYIKHPSYTSWSMDNDIALLKFSQPVSLNDHVQTIELDNSYAVRKDCVISGWGYTQVGGRGMPNILQEAPTSMMTESECKRHWNHMVSSNQVCLYTGYTGGCMGDSGGPLVCRSSSSGSYTLVGLTSFGKQTCNPTSPSVYTRIAAYRTWIQRNSGV